MIKLTKLNNDEFYLNPHLIERIDEKADTVITMDSQTQYIVKEKFAEILKKTVEYRKSLSFGAQE